MTPQDLEAERRHHLARIGQLLDCEVLTYAARVNGLPAGPPLPISVANDDLLPFVDMLSSFRGRRIAVILETPGGAGTVARQMVEILHERCEHLAFIVPGSAKSAGTIMVMGGHEILMGPGSSLGPIDAQLQQGDKAYSADAFLEGLERIKREVKETGELSPVYIPILQRISPGEIEQAHNALEFARATVREWLATYKFGGWTRRETSGQTVTEEDRRARAKEIGDELAKQSKWHTHGRSLRIPDLEQLGLRIRDFSKEPELNDAIQRYHVLLQMHFEQSPVFKIIETAHAGVERRFQPQGSVPPAPLPSPDQVSNAMIEVPCPNCRAVTTAQLDFKPGIPLKPGAIRYPDSGDLACGQCGTHIDIRAARHDLEQKLGRPALTPQPSN